MVVDFGISPDVIERMPIDRFLWWADAIADRSDEMRKAAKK
jgi:hypothetical protein